MFAPLDAARPHKRKGFWYLIRRVPREFEAFDKRGLVMLSTGIRIVDDPLARAVREAVRQLDEGLGRSDHMQWDLPQIFDNLWIRGATEKQRVAFPAKFV